MHKRGTGHMDGFTIVELVTTMMIMGVLVSITWVSVASYLQYARDSERTADTTAIVRVFERYYRTQSATNGVPTYPTVTQVNTASQRTLIIPDNDERIVSPYQSATSLIAATTTTTPTPTKDQYIYQPYTATNTICTGAVNTPCVRFMLYLRKEVDNTVVVLESVHQQ